MARYTDGQHLALIAFKREYVKLNSLTTSDYWTQRSAIIMISPFHSIQNVR